MATQEPEEPQEPEQVADPASDELEDTIPTELAGFSVGQAAPAPFEDPPEVEVFGMQGYLRLVSDAQGQVSHIFFIPNTGPQGEDWAYLIAGDPRYQEDPIIDLLTAQLGSPTEIVSPLSGPISWKGEAQTLEFEYVPVCCGDEYPRLMLRTNDPTRECGPEDGFEQWADELARAARDGDFQAVADRFAFPFFDRMRGSIGVDAAVYGEPYEFEDRAALLARLPQIDLEDFTRPRVDGFEPLCQPGEGYRWYLGDFSASGVLQVDRIDGQWMARGIEYVP